MLRDTKSIRLALERLLDDLILNGASAEEAIDVITRELASLRRSVDQDPDPADDPA